MASHIPVLDIQEDSLRLVLSQPGTPSRFYRRVLPSGLMQQGRILNTDGLAGEIRRFFRESGIPLGKCILILPREIVTIRQGAGQLPSDSTPYEFASAEGFTAAVRREDLDGLRKVLGRAGISPVCALPREAACQALVPRQESVCLVLPEADRWQALFFREGQLRMARSLDGPQALKQILLIFQFSNPDSPRPLVYLPHEEVWQLGGDWDVRPLEGLLPDALPPEGAAPAGGALWEKTRKGAFRFRKSLHPRHISLALGLILAAALFVYGGIYKPLDAWNRAISELTQQQTLAAQLDARLSGYDALSERYLRTGGGILTEAELAMVDRNALLELVEQVICPRAKVTEFTLSGSTLTLHLTEISLQEAGILVAELQEYALIDQAQLHSAEADGQETSNIFLRITLTDAGKEGEA